MNVSPSVLSAQSISPYTRQMLYDYSALNWCLPEWGVALYFRLANLDDVPIAQLFGGIQLQEGVQNRAQLFLHSLQQKTILKIMK